MLESRLFGNHATKFKALFRPKNHHFCWPDIHQDTENIATDKIPNSIKDRIEQHSGSWEENPTTSEYQKKWTGESRH